MEKARTDERKERESRIRDAAIIRVKSAAMERRQGKGSVLTGRQIQMLSCLSTAQLKHFQSYSPARQARIMTEIE